MATPEALREPLKSEQDVLDLIHLTRTDWPAARQLPVGDPDLGKYATDPGPERYLSLVLLDVEVESPAVASLYVAILKQASESWVARARQLLDGAQADAQPAAGRSS